jgi:hypothetical protein
MNRINVPFPFTAKENDSVPDSIFLSGAFVPRATILDGVRDMEYVVLSLISKVKKRIAFRNDYFSFIIH